MSVLPASPSEVRSPTAFVGPLWDGVARVVDRMERLDDLREHRLQLVAAARLRERGRTVPSELADEARASTLAALAVPVLLTRMRAACSGPLVLFKGAEAALSYPTPTLRPYLDVDVLVPDAAAAEQELLAAGFTPVGEDRDYTNEHHRRPLAHPDVPISVEVHAHPKWVRGLGDPPVELVFSRTVPSSMGVEGVAAPSPAMHAVLLAAHAWAERPLGRLGDILDVAALSARAPDGEAAALAHDVGIGRIWDATTAAARAVFLDGRRTWPLRTWARHLAEARGRTVLESHLARLLTPFAMLPPGAALPAASRAAAQTLRRSEAEPWGAKLARSRRAVGHARMGRSEHEDHLQGGRERGGGGA